MGPCNVSANLGTEINFYSWSKYSSLLFFSQPIGVGFSYETTDVGYLNGSTLEVTDEPIEGQTEGRHSLVDPERFDTSYMSAVGAWEIVHAFCENLEKLDNTVQNKSFNLWTESYGGHYGPTFFQYFYEQDGMIKNGPQHGIELKMNSLGIINGFVDALIQSPYYPEFAANNTYGIKAINDTIYSFPKTMYEIPGGCRDSILACDEADRDTEAGIQSCVYATRMSFLEVCIPSTSGGKMDTETDRFAAALSLLRRALRLRHPPPLRRPDTARLFHRLPQ